MLFDADGAGGPGAPQELAVLEGVWTDKLGDWNFVF
jgi:hypothetical protein